VSSSPAQVWDGNKGHLDGSVEDDVDIGSTPSSRDSDRTLEPEPNVKTNNLDDLDEGKPLPPPVSPFFLKQLDISEEIIPLSQFTIKKKKSPLNQNRKSRGISLVSNKSDKR
jgi:hypothetical protein